MKKERKNIKEFKKKLKKDLYKLHILEGKSLVEITAIYNSYYTTIKRWMKEFNIPITKENCGLKPPEKGTEFGKLVFIDSIDKKDKYGHPKWICFCKCTPNIKRIFSAYHLTQGRTKSCGCIVKETSSNIHWRGYEQISLVKWHNIQRDALKRNLSFDITLEYVWDLYVKQNGKCNLSGVDIIFTRNNKNMTASLDRIDNAQGYIIGNVQWLHKDVNLAKRTMSNKDFIQMCVNIAVTRGEL